MKWPLGELGKVIQQRREFIFIDDFTEYKRCRVQLHAQGIVLRDTVSGAEIKTKKQQICKAGDFLVAEIDAKVGGFGIVPTDLDGAIVSSHYFLFEVDEESLNRHFLDYFIRTPNFRDQVTAQGSTNYAAIRPSDVLDYKVPLPPLPEQRRIVARIEELAAKINEARGLREETAREGDRLLVCMAHRDDLADAAKTRQGWRRARLGDVMQHVDDAHRVQADASFPNLGIYSFGRGLFHKAPIDGALTSATTLRRVRKGQFIYSRLFAFEGAYGFVSDEFDGYFVSNEYPTFDCDPERVRVEFVAAYFQSPFVWKEVAAGSKGLGDRRQRVQPEKILSHNVWLPPMQWQNRIVQVRWQLDELKNVQIEAATELAAMLPSILDKAFKGEL